MVEITNPSSTPDTLNIQTGNTLSAQGVTPTPTVGVTGIESPLNPTGGLVETPAQAAVKPGQFPNPLETPTGPTKPVEKPVTPVDNSKAIAETQTKIADLQSQADALNKYGLTDTEQLTKDTAGNWIPKPIETKKEVSTPFGIDTATQKGLVDFYNQDKNAFKDWAKSQNWSDTQILNIAKDAEAQNLEDTRNEANDKIRKAMDGTLTADQQVALDGLQRQWDATVDAQKKANETYSNQAMTIAALQGRTKYNITNVMGEVQQAIDTGINRIAQFQAAGQAAVAAMRAAFQEQNFKRVTEAYNQIMSNDKAISDTISDMYDKAYTAQKDIADRLYTEITKPIQDIAAEAAKNGMKDTSAISKSKSVQDAINAAGSYLQEGTGDMAEYLFYKRDKESNGLTPLDWQSWYDKKQANQIKLESSKAYASAYASAMGKAAADKINGVNEADTNESNPDAKEILGQTGLSKLVFDYLTTGTKALTRLTATERLKTISDAGEWLKSHGVDASTFISQYEAYNATLENNIKRVNQVKVSEGELKGTLDNLAAAGDDSSFGSIRWENVVKLFAGQEFNDPNVSRYSFHLTQLRNELAMYNAAASGKINNDGSVRTDDGDLREASQIIKDGFAAGSIEGFNEALKSSVGKMDTVLNNSLNVSRQNVWKLFGVGQNFSPTYDTPEQYVNTSQANQKEWKEATDYLKSRPDIVTLDAKGEPSAEDVFQYIMSK